MKKKVLLVLVTQLLFVSASLSLAADIAKFTFLKISPQDHKAVVKTPEGKLQLVGEGDIVGENATVVEIVEGRVVLEERLSTGIETVIIRLDGTRQQVERLRRQGEPAPVMVAPVQSK